MALYWHSYSSEKGITFCESEMNAAELTAWKGKKGIKINVIASEVISQNKGIIKAPHLKIIKFNPNKE